MDANVVAENILRGDNQRADYELVPSAVFTLPPLAGSGHDRIASDQVKPALPHQSRNDYGLGVLEPDRAKARFTHISDIKYMFD
jgi:hypothetical protein